MPRPRPQANPVQDLVDRLRSAAGRRPPMTAADALNGFTVSAVSLGAAPGASAPPAPPLMSPEGVARELRLDGAAARGFIAAARPVLASPTLDGLQGLLTLALQLGVREDRARLTLQRVAQAAAAHRPIGIGAMVPAGLASSAGPGWLYRSEAKRSGPVPQAVRDNARRGLEYRRKQGTDKAGLTAREAGKQGIGSGVVRATQLAGGGRVSLAVLRQMRDFFNRHAGNKAIAAEHKGEPWKDKGYVAWLLWGGDAARAWANREIARLEGDSMQKAQKVIATGKRGGKIVGYKPDGSPIYGKDEPETERTAAADEAGAPDAAQEPEPERPAPKVDDEPLSEDGPPLDDSDVGDPSPTDSDDDDSPETDTGKMHSDLQGAFDRLEAVEALINPEMVPVFNQLKADMRAMAERIDKMDREWRGRSRGSSAARGTRTALDDLIAMVGAFVRFASTVGKRAVEAADRRLKGDKATNKDGLTKAVAALLRTQRLNKGHGQADTAAWFLGRLVALDAAPAAQLDESEIPDALGRLLKGRAHKYIRRVPKPGGGYRYYYRTSGVTRDVASDLKPGAKFKLEHNGEAGHFEVIGAAGGQVRLRHDETRGEMTVSAAALADLLKREHAEVVQARRERLKRDIAAAKKHGTDKQVARLEAEAKRHGFDVDDRPTTTERNARLQEIIDEIGGDGLTADEQRQREEAARASAAKRRGPSAYVNRQKIVSDLRAAGMQGGFLTKRDRRSGFRVSEVPRGIPGHSLRDGWHAVQWEDWEDKGTRFEDAVAHLRAEGYEVSWPRGMSDAKNGGLAFVRRLKPDATTDEQAHPKQTGADARPDRNEQYRRHHDPDGPREPIVPQGRRFGIVRAPGMGAGSSYYVWDDQTKTVVDHPPSSPNVDSPEQALANALAWEESVKRGSDPLKDAAQEAAERWRGRLREASMSELARFAREWRGNLRATEGYDKAGALRARALLDALAEERARRGSGGGDPAGSVRQSLLGRRDLRERAERAFDAAARYGGEPDLTALGEAFTAALHDPSMGGSGADAYIKQIASGPGGAGGEVRRIYDELTTGRKAAQAQSNRATIKPTPSATPAPDKQLTRAQIENAIAGQTHSDFKSGRGKNRSIMHRGKIVTLSELSPDELLDLYADKHSGERVGIKESTGGKRASKPAPASAFPPSTSAQPIRPHEAVNVSPGSFIYQDGQPFMSVDENGRYRDADGRIVAKGRARMTLISARDLTAIEPTAPEVAAPAGPAEPVYRIEPGTGPAPYADALGVKVTPEQMPARLGRDAYQWSSHYADQRGEQVQADYLQHVESVAQQLAQAAKSDEAKAEAARQLEAYRDGYAKRVKAWLGAKGQTFSWAVTGRGGLTPAKIRSNEKKMQTERRRLDELIEWKKKANRRALKAVQEIDNPPPPPKPKADDGRVPFFQHRDEANAVTIEDDASADRIRLHFDGKPDAEMIAKLKSRGFRWSRAQGAWQRQRTDNARYAIRALGIDYPAAGGLAKSYRPDAPPADVVKRIKARHPDATAKDIRAWVHTFNSVFEATDGDESAKDAAAFPAAWSTLADRMKRRERADGLRKALNPDAPRDASAIVHDALRELSPPPQPNRSPYPYVGRIALPGGLTVNVENARGMVRRGVDSDGHPWAVQMPAHYGEIHGTLGADGDPIDVFVGPDVEAAPMVFLVALRDARTGAYDEDKVFVGFRAKAEALATYRAAYDRGGLALDCRAMAYPEFLAWLERHGHRGRRIDAGRVTSLRKALGHRIPPAPFRERARDELRRGMVRVVDRLRGDTRTDSPREVAIHAATARAL